VSASHYFVLLCDTHTLAELPVDNAWCSVKLFVAKNAEAHFSTCERFSALCHTLQRCSIPRRYIRPESAVCLCVCAISAF
jgi:hypothetical protein